MFVDGASWGDETPIWETASASCEGSRVSDVLLDSEGDLARPVAVDAMRGTNVVVGLGWLRERALEERYLVALGQEMRNAILSVGAMDWVPLPIVEAHYAGLDSLGLSFDDRLELGASASRHVNGVVLRTIIQLAGKLGVSPFTPLARAAKLFARNFRGGAVAAYKVGPTEARFEVLANSLAASACHRDNLQGALLDGTRPFASDVRVTEIVAKRSRSSYAFRIKW